MATVVINKTIEIKNVTAQRGGDILRADRSWTAGNIQRMDLSGDNPILEGWEFTVKYNTKAELDAFRDFLRAILYGTCYFWVDEMSGTATSNSIYARIEPLNYDRVSFGKNGTWNNNGRSFSFKVQEIPEV